MRMFVLSVIFLSGCTGWTGDPEQPAPEWTVGVSATIAPETPGSKTGMNGSVLSFVSGDKIGVSETAYTNRTNVLFSYNGSAWSTTTPMYWFDPVATHKFYAYYPYNAANSGNVVTMPILANQTVSTTVDLTCDMLVTGPKQQARSGPGGASVGFTFTHAFALLQFNVSMGVINLYELKAITVQGGNPTGGSAPYGIANTVNTVGQIGYNLVSGAVQTTANNSTSYTQTMVRTVTSSPGLIGSVAVTFYVLVLPGQYLNPVPAVRFRVGLLGSSGQNTEYANLSNSPFLAGNKYVYDVKIGGSIITKTLARDTTEPELPLTVGPATVVRLSDKRFTN